MMSIIEKYQHALEIAKANEELSCHVIDIEKTIRELKFKEPTVLDEVWVDYFLKKNDKEAK
jgi:hypothetical protein